MILIESSEDVERTPCLFGILDRDDDRPLIIRPMPEIHPLADQWVRMLKEHKIIRKDINPISLVYEREEGESGHYTKVNFFPIRYLWEKPDLIDNIFKLFYFGFSFREAFLLGHYYNAKDFLVDLCFLDEHIYLDEEFPINFYDVIDAININPYCQCNSGKDLSQIFEVRELEESLTFGGDYGNYRRR